MNLGKKLAALALALPLLGATGTAHAVVGYADVVLGFFDSNAGPMAGPYGGSFPGGIGFPVPVSTSVVLGPEPGVTGFNDFLSLPTGSSVTVGFTDETVIDGPGNDIFIQEVGANGERARVLVSADGVNFVFLGTAIDDQTTALDLASIGFTGAVRAITIIGQDSFGGSPGFDVMNVQVLPGSIGPAPVPEPASALLALAGLGLLLSRKRRQA